MPGPVCVLGPILANRVEFRLTAGYRLNSFFGRFWHAKMEKQSKLLNPRAAACHSGRRKLTRAVVLPELADSDCRSLQSVGRRRTQTQ